MKLRSTLLLSLSIATAVVGQATAKTVYVDCNGSGGEDSGTEKDPYRSLEKVNQHKLSPGDTLAFKRGSTCKGTLQPKGSGEKDSPITVNNYGGDDDAADLPIIDGQGANEAVLLVNQDYWNISQIDLRNPADKLGSRRGIQVIANESNPHTGITIDRIKVSDVAGETNKKTEPTNFAASAGISITGLYNDVLVTGCTVKDCGGGAIKVRPGYGPDQDEHDEALGKNVKVSHNSITSCGGDGIIVSFAETPLIEYNTAGHLGKGKYPYKGGNFAGMWVLGCHDSTLQYNVVHDTIDSVTDSQAFDCDWGNTGYCLIQYNFARDNAGGMFLNCDGCGTYGEKSPDQILRYNVFQNDCEIYTNGDNAKLYFYNNVVYCPEKNYDLSVPKATNFTNNIFVGTKDSKLPTGDSVSWMWNIFQTVAKPTDGGIQGDPRLVDPGKGAESLDSAKGYMLKSDSPGIGNGGIIPDNGGKDFFGNPVSDNAKPNRGAYNGKGE